MFDSPLFKVLLVLEREREEIKAALFLFSFCFVALPLIRNTAFLTQLRVQSLYLLITRARLAKQRFSHWWVLVEYKVQGIKGHGYWSSWGWRWGRNQDAQLCSTAGRRDQDIGSPNLGLTRKISSASPNYLSLELKNFWWTKALLTEHTWRWRIILFLFAFCNLFWWFNTECVSSYSLHLQASIFCLFPEPFQSGTWLILILSSLDIFN